MEDYVAQSMEKAAEPVVIIESSESKQLKDNVKMSLLEADEIFNDLSMQDKSELQEVIYKIKYVLYESERSYEGSIYVGDKEGGIIDHIYNFNNYFKNNAAYQEYLVKKHTSEEVKEFNDMFEDALQRFVPYLRNHINLLKIEQIVKEELDVLRKLDLSNAANYQKYEYNRSLLDYVNDYRKILNLGDWNNLPEMPKLEDFKQKNIKEPFEHSKDKEDYVKMQEDTKLEYKNISDYVKKHKDKLDTLGKEASKKSIVINAYGGAGAGKSTACLSIVSELKKQGYVAEYVSEYAKDLVWDKNFEMLDGSEAHQFDILQEQVRRMDRLYGQVDFIVTDSPILLNTIYNKELTSEYEQKIDELYKQYENFNFVVERDVNNFEEEGRIHTLQESMIIDKNIKNMLSDKGLYYGIYNHSNVDKVVGNSIVTHNRLNGINPHGEEKNNINTEKNKTNINSKEELMKELKNGIETILDSEQFAQWCKKQGSLYFNRYSFRNAILVYFQNPEATYVRGYEAWKEYGRQVRQGAKGVKVFSPVFVKEYGEKGSLYRTINKNCKEQFLNNPDLDYATFKLGETKLKFNMYKNGLYDVILADKTVQAHITEEEVKKFIDQNVVGKIPVRYNVSTVFDVKDTTDNVKYLWVKNYDKNELALDENGNVVKNKKGQYRIYNSEERKARFNEAQLNMQIKENDIKKMSFLYDALITVSEKAGVPVTEMIPESDKILADGALGYYNGETNEIVISSELSPTNKVSTLFHEVAHSKMHKDLKALKETMEQMNNEEVEITRSLKETQAEAVAYMTASNFGIETDNKSFGYIALWSKGRELKELGQSLEYIYKESKSLMQEIEKELDIRGLTLQLELKNDVPMSTEEKDNIIVKAKEFTINKSRLNEEFMKNVIEDLKNIRKNISGVNLEIERTVKEQVVLSHKIDEKINFINNIVNELEKSDNREEQLSYEYQLNAAIKNVRSYDLKIKELQYRVDDIVKSLSLLNEKNNEETDLKDIKNVFINSPETALKILQKVLPEMKNLSENDLIYIAKSKFIAQQYVNYLGADNHKFAELAIKQLNNMKEVISKNNTAVEIYFCEQWTERTIFKHGAVMHPKIANNTVKAAEKEIENLKEKAEKEGEYFPYNKCCMNIYSIDKETGKLIVFDTRIDIGDGEQKDIKTHLDHFGKTEKNLEILQDNFASSIKERQNAKMLLPDNKTNETMILDEKNNSAAKSMESWKSTIRNYLEEEQENENQNKNMEKNIDNKKEKINDTGRKTIA